MKKINLFLVFIASILFMACDPIEDRNELIGTITADQLNASVTAAIVDGKPANKIYLKDQSACLINWYQGDDLISIKTLDSLIVGSAGTYTFTLVGLNGDGTKIKRDYNVAVEEVFFSVPGVEKFAGGTQNASKTWVWDEFSPQGTPWGIGGAVNDKSPAWWGPGYGSFDESDANLTFTSDMKLIKTLGNGTKVNGKFSFDLDYRVTVDGVVSPWCVGLLRTPDGNVPHPVSANEGGGSATEFYIVALSDDQMILATLPGNKITSQVGAGGEANFWLFRPEGYSDYNSDKEMEIFTGGSEKTWTWGAGIVFGNGSSLGSAPAWWTLDAAGAGDQAAGEGPGATMTFRSDKTMTKLRTDGTSQSGTFGFSGKTENQVGEGEGTWAISRLKTADVSVLAGISPNESKAPVYEYGVITLEDNKIVLGYACNPGSGNEGWYWVFAPVE